jgi:DNA-binding SARP family transcriptional activator
MGQDQGSGAVRFGLLGPLQVSRNGVELPVRVGKPRVLLVALLLDAGRPVPADRLVAALWEGGAPPTARASLNNHVHALRRALGDPEGSLVQTAVPGYLIAVDPGDLDVQVFQDRLRRGRAAHRGGDWALASGELGAALTLWRGEPLPDLRAAGLLAEAAARWSEQRLQALEWRIDSDLHLGRHHDVIAELSELAAAHPMRESFAGLLMMACYQSGRQADALSVYRHTRQVLIDELGAEPGAHLQDLHQRILAADPVLLPAPPSSPPIAARPPEAAPVPAQLPAAIGDFTGRDAAVKHLADSLTTESGRPFPGTVVITAVTGAGGIGKTTLAVHVAHQIAADFPDGQLYVNLRGTAAQPVAASAVLARLLRDLGADPATIPAGDEERAARYRSLVAGRRLLLLLDDAHDTRQVMPLVPGTPGCAVLVTSRGRLPDLTASARLGLDVLTEHEARQLFSRIIGLERAAAEPQAVGAVLRACSGLPLAVRIAGARLASRRSWTVRTLAERLTSERDRLDELSVGGLAVRASFQVSYQSLAESTIPADAGLTQAFRLLGVAQQPDLSLPAAAALLGRPIREAERVLERLVDTNLVETVTPGRYRLHDLLRIFAVERAEAEETAHDQASAIRRLLAWHVRTSDNGRHHLLAGPGPLTDDTSAPTAPTALTFTGNQQALDWYHAQGPGFLPAVRLAVDHALPELGWRLAATLWSFYRITRNWSEWIATYRIGLDCALELGDLRAQALLLNGLAAACVDLKRHEQAMGYCTRALAIRRELGDMAGQASSMNNLGICLHGLGRPAEGIAAFEESLRLYRAAGDLNGCGSAANNLGNAHMSRGRYDLAEKYLRQCIALCHATGNERLETLSLANLGEASQKLGRPDEAIRFGHEAVTLARRVGDPYGLACTLDIYATVCREQGHNEESRACWTESLALFTRLGATESGEVGARLAALGAPTDAHGRGQSERSDHPGS